METECNHEFPIEHCLSCMEGLWLDLIDQKKDAIRQMRGFVSELYALRGEDAMVSKYCNKAMAIADKAL